MKSITSFLFTAVLLLSAFSPIIFSSHAETSGSIAVEEFRWTTFPLKVLVDMNQWSLPTYAADVHESLDAWMEAIWNYSQTYNDTTLANANCRFYLSNVNSTSSYDVFITFTPDEISLSSDTVGLTTYSWYTFNHKPAPPIIINITTYSATASDLFIRNVAMHEFGHALGLGHASSQSTSDGAEVMYYSSPRNQAVYPTTLDVYALTVLYRGNYAQTVQLPPDIPYEILTNGNAPPPPPTPTTDFWQGYRIYLPLALIVAAVILAIALTRVGSRKEPEETTPQPPQPPPPPPPLPPLPSENSATHASECTRVFLL